MHNYLMWVAVVLSFITFYVHTFIGSPRVAIPLLMNKDLPRASKWLNFYCWHMVTIYLFIMGGGYVFVALHQERPELVVFLTILNTNFAILSVIVAIKGKIKPLHFPSTTLFTLLSLVGISWLMIR